MHTVTDIKTLLGGLRVMVCSKLVCWETAFCLETALFGVDGSGASGSCLSSATAPDSEAEADGSFAVSKGVANTSWCAQEAGSDWLLGRLWHPSDDVGEHLCGVTKSSPLQGCLKIQM